MIGGTLLIESADRGCVDHDRHFDGRVDFIDRSAEKKRERWTKIEDLRTDSIEGIICSARTSTSTLLPPLMNLLYEASRSDDSSSYLDNTDPTKSSSVQNLPIDSVGLTILDLTE